eukprot:scaffold22596_cov131-Cylindrotheca_fusiformis.AAC.6
MDGQGEHNTAPGPTRGTTKQASSILRNDDQICFANRNDILFGRGRGYHNHPGNMRMRQVIDRYRESYHTTNRGDKHAIVRIVYNKLIEGGARFLKRNEDEDSWMEVGVDLAMGKVGHSLRCKKGRAKQLSEAIKNTRSIDVGDSSSDNRLQSSFADSRRRSMVEAANMSLVCGAPANTNVENSVLGNNANVPFIHHALACNTPVEQFNRQLRTFANPAMNGLVRRSYFDLGVPQISYAGAMLQAQQRAASLSIPPLSAGVDGPRSIELYRAMLRDQLLRDSLFPSQR